MVELTLVMAAYNGEPYLRPALESVTTQSIRDFVVLIIDDGSTDGTAAILEEYSSRDRRITVIHQENAGVVAALNRACALVDSPYIARLDADDISMPGRLERQLDFLNRNPEVALLGGAALVINHAGDPLYRMDVPTSNADIKTMLPTRNVFVNSAVVMRRNALSGAGGYRHPFQTAEDYDLWLRIAERCDVANLPDVVVQYRVHPRQATSTQLERQVLAAMGSRVSSKLRQAKKDDPFESRGPVTKDALCRLGVSASEIEAEIAKAAADWAWVMQRAGYHEAAASLAQEAWRRGRGRVLTRDAVGRFYLVSARESLCGGHKLHGLVNAGRALRWKPALLWRMLRGAIRRLTR